jgi:rare lipoprotein A
LLIVPLVLIHGDPEASASPPGTTPDRHGDSPPHRPVPKWKLASDTNTTPPTGAASGGPSSSGATTPTPTDPGSTTPPASGQAAPGAEVAQRVAAVVTTTTSPPTPTPPAPVAVVVSGPVHYGQVTYYDHPAGTCASPWLSFGTVVRVTNPDNGYSVNCVVNDREADTTRSIDLATSTFAELAPLSQGVIDAQLSW